MAYLTLCPSERKTQGSFGTRHGTWNRGPSAPPGSRSSSLPTSLASRGGGCRAPAERGIGPVLAWLPWRSAWRWSRWAWWACARSVVASAARRPCERSRRAGYGAHVHPRWPSGPHALTLVRHGESIGNQADQAARDAGAEELELSVRDADVELSETGRQQAEALGRWMADAPEELRPTLVLCLAVPPCGADRRGGRSPGRAGGLVRRATARARPRRLRRPHRPGDPGAAPRGGGATHASGQVLLPAAERGELGRRGRCGCAAFSGTCATGTTGSGSGCSATRR